MTNHNQRREQILTVASRLFAEKGFAATTTRELNAEVGIADGLLYYYFPKGKQQLLDTIVENGLAPRLSALTVDLDGIATATALEARLLQLLRDLWAILASPEGYQVFVITIRERPALSPTVESTLSVAMQTVEKRLAAQLAALDWLPMALPARQLLATTVLTLFKGTVYDHFLLADTHTLTPPIVARVRSELHALLTPLAEA